MAEGDVDFFQISTNKFYQFVNTPSRYLDNISFRKISCKYNYGTEYMIRKVGQGDAILIDECHFASSADSFNNNGIYLSNSWGATIQNIINGYHYFTSCINTTIQDCHIERGSFTFVDSIINFKNSYIWKIPGTTPLTLIDSDKRGGYGNYNVSQNYKLSQIIFELRYATFNYTEDTSDVDLTNINQAVFFENCYRRAEPLGGGKTLETLTGIMIDIDSTKKFKPEYDKYFIKSKTLFTNDRIMHSGSYSSSTYYLNSISEIDTVTGNFENNSYFYKLQNILDVERQLGASASQEKSITKTNLTKSNVLVVGANADNNTIFRIYRGTQAGIYTKYVDIPNVKNNRLIDNGSTLNGFAWEDYNGDVISLNYCEIEEKDNNYQGNCVCELGAAPSNGTWKRGDKVYNHNPSAGRDFGWICVSEGTPGT